MRVVSAREAAALVPDGATIAVSGGSYRAVPESLLEAIEARFVDERRPEGCTVVALSMLERSRKGRGGEGSGLNRLAHRGLMSRLVVSSFSRNRESALNRFAQSDEVAAYNYPMGTILQWLRASAAGRRGVWTEVGVGTFVDPRLGGGCVGPGATVPLNRLETVGGTEMLFYPSLTVDVALVKATAADERGNLYLQREAYDHGVWDVAAAARRTRGLVIAEVNEVVEVGTVHPRMGGVPGPVVDAVVVREEPWEDEQDPTLTGAARGIPPARLGKSPRELIAQSAVRLLPERSMVNLGAGLPMYDVPSAARALGRDDLYFTVEQGPMGGWPQVGGATLNPELLLGQLEVFDFYEGGGPDVSVLAFGQIDRHGNVNVSRFGDMMPGCGGFVNIVHGARWLVFCGTLTTGGLAESVIGGTLSIDEEGRTPRFVNEVEQITFNGRRGIAAGQRVTVVTERATFEVTERGFSLESVVAGVDFQKDVLARIPFPVEVSPTLTFVEPGGAPGLAAAAATPRPAVPPGPETLEVPEGRERRRGGH